MTENERAARQKRISHTIMWIVLLILFICFIFPFLMVIINVFKTKADITANPLALIGAHGFTLKNFPEAMRKMDEISQTEMNKVTGSMGLPSGLL